MVTIRHVDTGDFDQWSALFEEYRALDHVAPDSAVVQKVWSWLTDPQFNLDALVAEEEAAIVGFALYRRVPRPVTATTGIYLDDVFVIPHGRNRGYASRLIAAVTDIAVANHATLVRWIASQDNATAQQLYDRIATRTTWITYENPLT